MSNNVSLVGVNGNEFTLDDVDEDPKNVTAGNKSKIYGFESLRKEFEESLNEPARIAALKNVDTDYRDLQ